MVIDQQEEPLARPLYDELPVMEELGLAQSWTYFGAGDELGSLNNIDDSVVLTSVKEVLTGERIGVSLEMSALDPPLYGRDRLIHTLSQTSRNTWDDQLDRFNPQGATQWDGFRHVRCREFGFYGGVREDPPAMGTRLGVQHWAEKGIVTRGVLLDVERYFSPRDVSYEALEKRSISAAQLEDVAREQGVEIRQGDVLCLRFGWTSAYRRLDELGRRALADPEVQLSYVGLAADETMARALWDWRVAAVACDNPAVEVSPGDAAVGSLHRRLIPALGVVLGELFDFDRLAARCAQDGRWSFLFLSVPLNLPGGVGSPANAIAIR